MALSVGRITSLIELRDQFTSQLQKMAAEVNRTAPKIEELQKKFESIGKVATGAGITLSAAVTAPILGVMGAAIKLGTEFEGAMNKVKAAIPDGDMERLRAAAVKMGADTVFTSTEAAEALSELGKAGMDSATAVAALPSVLQLAIAGQMGMADAATLASNTMATFKLSAEQMGHANDVLAKAAASSTIDVRDLAEGMKYVGPVAATTGVSLETVSASMALMGEAGIKGSMAGTALRGVLTTLMTPTDKQAALMEKLGLQTAFANGKMAPLSDILAMVEDHIKKTGNAGQTSADLMELFGDRAGPGLVALVDKGSGALRDMEKKLNDTGFAARQADALMEGMPGAIERLKGSVETAAQSLGSMMAPAVSKVADLIAGLANFLTNTVIPAFDKLPTPIKIGVGAMVALAASIGPLLLAIGGLSYGWASLLPLFVRGGALLFTLGNTVPVLTARLWLMDAAEKSLGVSGWAALAPLTAIAAAIAGIVLALPKAIDGLRNLGVALHTGDWSKIFARDEHSMDWIPGMGKGGPGTQKTPDTYLPPDVKVPDTSGIPAGLATSTTQFADALKAANDHLSHMSAAKLKDINAAIESGALGANKLQEMYGLNDIELSILTDRVKKHTDAVKKQADEQKRAAEKMKDFIDAVTGTTALKDAADTMAALAAAEAKGYPVALMTRDAQEQINQKMVKAAEVYRAMGRDVPENIRSIVLETTDWKKITDGMSTANDGLNDRIKRHKEALTDVAGETLIVRSYGEDLTKTLNKNRHGFIELTESADDVAKRFKPLKLDLRDLAQSLSQLAQISGGAFGNVAKGLSAVVAAADTANQSIGKIKDGIAEFGKPKGSGLAGILSMGTGILGIASAAITAGKAIAGMFKHEGRDDVKKFVTDTYGDFDTLHKKLLAIGREDVWVQITQGVGRDNPQEAKAAIDAVTQAFADQESKIADTKSAVNDLIGAHLGGAGLIPAALQPSIDKLVEMGVLTKDNAAAMLGFADDAVPSFADVKAAADVLGVSLDSIGGSIAQMAFSEKANEALAALKTLEAAGADMGAVFAQSVEKIQPLVDEALRTGRELPEAMKPYIQQMIDAGLLTDASGNKLKDLSGINFAEPLTKKIDDLITKIMELIDSLAGPNGAAKTLEGLGRTRINPIKIPYYYEQEGPGPGEQGTRDPMDGASSGNTSATINVNMDGRTVTRAVVPNLADEVTVNVS